jgi:dethiobiotin synthetase
VTAPSLPPLCDLLVTGTDTGIGKTWVTAALAAACVASGRRVAVLKAAQTGAPDDDAAWIAARVPGIVVRTALRYEAAVAPAVAARLEGAPEPRLEPIVALARELRAEAGAILVEGSGGLLVPINDRETFADLALALDLPLLIVARPGLGTLNHTALTVEVAQARGITVAGIIVCGTSADPDVAERTNLTELRRIAPLLAAVPHDPEGWPAPAKLSA